MIMTLCGMRSPAEHHAHPSNTNSNQRHSKHWQSSIVPANARTKPFLGTVDPNGSCIVSDASFSTKSSQQQDRNRILLSDVFARKFSFQLARLVIANSTDTVNMHGMKPPCLTNKSPSKGDTTTQRTSV